MPRVAVTFAVALGLALASRSPAAADCASTCGDVCYAPEVSALFRVEVTDIASGAPRVVILERLGGSSDVEAEVGDELADIYSDAQVTVGDELVVVLARFDDGSGTYAWNTAWRLEGDAVICNFGTRTVPLASYVDMATSSDCEARAVDLQIASGCDDTFDGCSAAGAPSLLAALAALGLVVRRRSRNRRS
jgi:uncharacterized protein (TIGR03382 family)